ncbi:hypothetical protein C8D88_104348 [Lentzea atacamensis]|uniref:Uncharacterized protein n=2 Tax=Lentzea TaxID=165301 RepID=A0A316I442_9PSEU|nr:hypothetical protein [Lentzea atacamensis]PWK87187.1 hypothetical protein C8D88_104348 [Lentzea atacamensis]RAS70107.1 hypothetical protein C8D87_101407 [Lentzea atacamensis]
MANGLIRMTGDHVGFTESVSRIAESLKPLGPAGRHVAESYALDAEMRRVRLEENLAADAKEITLKLLDQRRKESSASLRQMRKELGRADDSARALRECMVNMQRETVKPGLPLAERRAYIELTQHFTTMLVQHHTGLTGGVAEVIDKVLNGSGATALAPQRRSPGRAPGKRGTRR